jgi:hypothetical protein
MTLPRKLTDSERASTISSNWSRRKKSSQGKMYPLKTAAKSNCYKKSSTWFQRRAPCLSRLSKGLELTRSSKKKKLRKNVVNLDKKSTDKRMIRKRLSVNYPRLRGKLRRLLINLRVRLSS